MEGFLSNNDGIRVAAVVGMGQLRSHAAIAAAMLFVVFSAFPARAQDARAAPRVALRLDPSVVASAARSVQAPPPQWLDAGVTRLPRYPFMADPRRWPRLFANTTECTLSLNPVTRRHWWQG